MAETNGQKISQFDLDDIGKFLGRKTERKTKNKKVFFRLKVQIELFTFWSPKRRNPSGSKNNGNQEKDKFEERLQGREKRQRDRLRESINK